MIVGVQGTSSFDDYQTFLRAMGVALSSMPKTDEHFHVYSAGPSKINSMAMEFVNVSEKGMKSRGKKVKFYSVSPEWIAENIKDFSYIAFFSKDINDSRLTKFAKENNIETYTFTY